MERGLDLDAITRRAMYLITLNGNRQEERASIGLISSFNWSLRWLNKRDAEPRSSWKRSADQPDWLAIFRMQIAFCSIGIIRGFIHVGIGMYLILKREQ